ncbi:MAG: TonB-dependent receptor [Paludibacter sp.]
MKKFTLILIGAFFASILVSAQQKQMTLKLSNVTVKEALETLKTKGGYSYWFDAKDLDVNQKISINVVNKTIDEVLVLLLKGQKVEYKIKDGHIVISKSVEKETPVQKKNELRKVTGIVLDEKGIPVIGASVLIPGTKIVAVTDINGLFSLEAPSNAKLRISYIGYEPKLEEIKVNSNLKISLEQTPKGLDEVVVVGYGSQKKQSVVGAIVQTKGSDLQRTGVFSSVGQALTGLLPGVSTQTVTGMPGAEDPKITIRGLSSWNTSDPLVLIDGVERKMGDIDMGQIEAISVLKDASATAVFGVKGAEGVILITTKRGKEGKAKVSFSSNTSFKYISKVTQKMDSYDSFSYQNEVLERQNPAFSSNWGWYTPQTILNKYRNPANITESEMYPNVDWANEVAKNYAITQRYDINIAGGTSFVKYFAALSYLKDEDILKSGLDVGLPYKPEWGFKHYNFRSNLDFNLTKTTVLSTNLAGSIRQKDGFANDVPAVWGAFYQLSPASYPIRYQDGAFGFDVNKPGSINPIRLLSGSSGLTTDYTTQIFTDFELKQDLQFITKGLSAKASLSYDNRMFSSSSISQISLLAKSIDPDGNIAYNPVNGGSEFDYYRFPGTFNPEATSVGSTVRKLYYKAQLNYARTFGKSDVSLLALMSREEWTSGSEFPHYREDWVGRLTYGFDNRYFIEANGAYNGSEKFASKYRFGFFPSVGLGWMLSNESFLKQPWLDKLKLRYSIGTVGSDNFASERWAYATRWGLDGGDIMTFGPTYTTTDSRTGAGATYLQYKESVVGNPNLHWEVSRKQNIGIDFSIFNGLFSGSAEVFQDDRSDVFMTAAQLAGVTPTFLGSAPVAANIGRIQNKGFEIDVKLQKTWSGVRYWIGYNFAHAVDKIIFRADPELRPDYQKAAGFQIGQPAFSVEQPGFTKSWDDLYGSVSFAANSGRLPGDVVMIDYNVDGVINSKDVIPYGYPNRPQSTYNTSFGVDYKGFSFMAQFFGVYNVSQFFNSIIATPDSRSPYVNSLMEDYWTPANPNAVYPLVRAGGTAVGQTSLTRGRFLDGSYLRLKNLELAYTYSGRWLKALKMSSVKLSMSGNNLLFWSKLPEDKEQTVDIWATGTQSYSLYPTVKRINFGLNVTF